jgi:hypothetical protein
MIEVNNLGDIKHLTVADNLFGQALFERMNFFFENLDVHDMKEIENVSLYALESQDELENLIIIKDNLDDNIEYIERSFIYLTDEEKNVTNHVSFIHFMFYNQDTDMSKEYIIKEDMITNEDYIKIIGPHVQDVYNEVWEQQYHEGN